MTLRRVQYSNAFGDQKFKRHFVPFNGFAALSIPALLHSVQKRGHPFKSAYLELNTERSEVLERCIAAFESRVAAIMNSSGTSCRSMASLHSAFQHCYAVFKKEVTHSNPHIWN
ncbi:hypothetical protein [Fidelibacter multiformis]|uniref:hypothetical protein n=1 Tax=Fidelibacter multiformis TaxID=3377529 RepID=UPI0037DD8197